MNDPERSRSEYAHYRRQWEADVGQRLTILSSRLERMEAEMSHMRAVIDTLTEMRKDVASLKGQMATWGGGMAVALVLVEIALKFVGK